MITRTRERAVVLAAFGWTERDAEWFARVYLHSGSVLAGGGRDRERSPYRVPWGRAVVGPSPFWVYTRCS